MGVTKMAVNLHRQCASVVVHKAPTSCLALFCALALPGLGVQAHGAALAKGGGTRERVDRVEISKAPLTIYVDRIGYDLNGYSLR